MAILRNDTTVRSADGQSTSPIITAANIGNYGISTTSTYYIGTTQNVFNRASGAQTLTGVSIDGNAATVTNGLTTTNYSSYALPISGGTMTGVLQSNKPINASGATYGSQATYVGNWSGTGWWGLGSESGHILKFDQVAYADVNSPTWIGATDLVLKLGTKFVRDSYYRTISGIGDYYASGASGWYTVASITLTTNCTGGVLYGTLYDHRYDGADAYQISIVARAECDFQTNNESHYVNVGCTILGSTNITNYQSKIRVLLVASSANSRTYEVQFLETAWNRDTWQLETSGSPVWTIYSTAQAPGTSTGTARVFYISNQNADNIRANTASYSPIYYDSSDTSYYSDPAGLNRFNALNIGNQGALTGNTTYALGAYHNSRYMVGLRYSSGGAAYPWLVHDSWNGSAFIIHFNGIGDKFNFSESGIGQAGGDFRAPIFYDSADTTYYLDPANSGTSLIVAGKIGSGVTSPAYELDFGILNETTSTDTIRFNSYNGPAGGGSGVGAATGGGSTIGGGITWKSNYSGYTKRSAGIMQIGEGNYFRAGLAFYTNNVTDQTTDWTEAMRISSNSYIGIGTASPDTNLQIVGHVHVGNQTTFENSGGWNKTIYLDGAIHARMRIIGSAYASGKNSQTETNIWVDNSVAPYSGLSTNAGSFTISAGYTTLTNSARSPIFYDSDNTAYYIDAASTSVINAISIAGNSTFSTDSHLTFGPNSTWGSSIRIGGNGYTATGTEMASVVTTDGNLHLDAAKSNNGIYMNWYGGTGGVYFGNGSAGQVANISNTGNASFSGTIDATQFRDASNTAYYTDPASTSNLYALTVNDTLTYGVVAAKSFSVSINTSTYWTVVRPNGSSIATGYVYRITLCTTGTGTDTGEQYLLANVDSAGWVIKTVTKTGSGSNWPYVFLDAGVPKVKTDHASLYTVTVLVEELNSGNTGGLPSVFGLAGLFTSDNGTPKYRAGWFSSDNTLLHSGNYSGYSAFSGSVSSGGNITATGYIYTSTYLQTGGNLIYPSGYGATQRLEVSNSANNNWIDGITIAPGGIVTAPYEMRSPIFYDSDNTAYYINAAGTSVLNALTVGGNNVLTTASTLTAGNLSGTIPSGVLGNSTLYVGTTAIALNRGSASQTLTGISIDGNAATASNATQFGGEANTNFMRGLAGGTEANINNYTDNGFRTVAYTGHGKGLLSFNVGSSIGTVQHEYFYNIPTNGWRVRNKTDNTTWSSWGNIVMTDTNQGALTGTVITTGNSSGLSPTFSNLYAAVFYDAADSTYYLDPANTTTSLKTRSSIIINNASAPQNLAMLNIGYNGAGETRAIDIYGSWSGGENKSITFNHASTTSDIVAQINAQHNGPASRLRWGKLYHGGNSSTYTMELISESTTSAYLTVAGSVRAPIFYDSNDTTYYLDPAAATSLNIAGQITTAKTNGTLLSIAGADTIGYNATAGRGAYIKGTGGTYVYGSGVYYDGSSVRQMLYEDTWLNSKYFDSNGIIYSQTSMRAPIFYDYNDTNYYIDPASTSVLNRLKVDGGNFVNDYFQSISDFASGTLVTTDIDASVASGESFVMNVVGKSYSASASPFNFSVQGYLYNSTIINYSGLSLDSTGLSTIKIFNNGGFLCFWWARVSYWNAFEVSVRAYNSTKANYNRVTNVTDSTEPVGSKKVTVTLQSFLRADVSATNSVDLRAPIFYDSNDTTYYTDPSSLSNILELKTNKNWYDNSASAWGGGINMGGNNPTIGFQSTSSTWWYMLHHASSNINFYRRSTSGSWNHDGIWDNSGNLIWQGSSVRAPIFYDQNDTTYYLDAASTSLFNTLKLAGSLQNNGSVSDDDGFGIYWDSGGSTAYAIYREAGSWTHPYPDLRIAFHTGIKLGANAGYNGIRFYDDYGMANQVMSVNNSSDGLGANNVYVNNSLQAGSSLRAPIFYDSNDTTYYIDPASTSRLVALWVRGSSETAGNIYVGGTAAGDRLNINYDQIWTPNGNLHLQYSGGGNIDMNYGGGVTFSRTSLRAPIFYDYNDTAYYCDPNGNSVLNGLYVNAYYNLVNDFKDIYVYGDVNTYYVVLIQGEYLYSYGRYSVTRGYNWTGPDTWNTATHKGGLTLDWEWSGDTAWGGNDKAIRIIEFNESYSTMVAGLGYPVNGGVIIWLRGGGVNGAQYRIRTPIGANSTVTVYDGVTATNHSSSTSFTAANSAVFSTRSDTSNVNSEINARYPVRGAASLYNEGSAVLDQSGTSQSKSGILSSAASLRAPIFYDTDNTGYYIDPAGSSNLSAVTADNYYAGGWFRNNGSGNGIYNQSTGQHFYSDNVSYWNVASSSGAQSIRFRTGGHNGTIRGYIYATDSNDVGLLNQDGNWRVRVVGGDYVLFDGSSIRAQIFYDSNDTGYYLDPAGTSNLNKLSAFTMSYNDMNSMHVNSPYVARYNGSALYRNGTMGYGTTDCNVMFSNWGSGFIDSWGSPANAPGGSTHYVGLQGFHYNHQNNSQAYGFQMLCAGEADNRFFWRSAWPNLRSWVEMIHSGNIGSQTVATAGSCTGNAATATRTSGQSGYPHAGTGMWAFYNWGGSDGGTSAPSASTYTTGLSVGSNPGDQAYGFQIANNMWNTGLWTRNYNSGFGSWIRLLDSSNYVGYSAFTGNVDGTQFRDANNTAYYIDPASTSNLVGLTVANTITGAVSGNAGSVTINYNNDSNSTYQMLWGSGNNVYGTAGVYLNPSTDVLYANAFYDAGNTAYYLDPNSTSNLLLVKTRNTFGERIAVTAASSTTIDTQYNVTELTMSTNVSLTLSNIQSSGTVHMWTIVTVGNGTAYSIGWPAAIKWPGGTAPTITSTNTKRDIYQFVTYDGGTTIYAIIVGQNL